MSKSKFALVLRQCRENSKLTQQQVADALGIERSTYAYYETDTTHPSCEFVVKVSQVLGIDYQILVEAVADFNFDNQDANENLTTLTSTSWQQREKMYTLRKDEQNIILTYRTLSAKDKENFSEELKSKISKKSA